MRRTLLLIGLCGCASGGNTVEDTTPKQAAIFTSAETGTLLGERPRAAIGTVAAPPANVWLAAKKVFADFEIPVTVENTSTHQLGNPNFYKSRQFAGRSMVQFVNCGSGMDGPKAASYRIYMSLLTSISSDGNGGTTIQTTFVPAGQDMGGNSADRIPCGTTGGLEAFFLERVKATLGKS